MTISSLYGPTDADGSDPGRLWHVTLTVAGGEVDVASAQQALERLNTEHPFLIAGRYAADRAELRYWEEADSCEDACALALRLWGEHRTSADLPPWTVVGLEVVERSLHGDRGQAPVVEARISPLP